jgi:hypothetical protein
MRLTRSFSRLFLAERFEVTRMPKIISGWVGRGGEHDPKGGFEVIHASNGVYEIHFLEPFFSRPTVVATKQYEVLD